MDNFEYAIEKLLAIEGGYVNDPDDPGGATNFGISLRFLKSISPNANITSIAKMTKNDAIEIYKTHYWQAFNLDKIVDKDIATFVLKLLVNLPPEQAVEVVQRAINSFSLVPVDVNGRMDVQVILHLNQLPVKFFMYILVNKATDYYRQICNNNYSLKKFLLGWLNRIYV